jgi:membrane protein
MYLPGSKGIVLYDVAAFFFRQVNKVGLVERASAISFNLIMALPAALLFLFSLVPYFPKPENLKKEILNLLKDITPNSSTYKFVSDILTDLLDNQHAGVFSFGFLLLIFYASNAMLGVIRTFDKSIQEHKNRIFMHKRWRAIRLTLLLMILVLFALFALLVGKEQMLYLMKSVFHVKRGERAAWWNGWNAIRWSVIVCLLFYGIGIIYKFAPSVKKRWKLVSPGSLLATTLTLLTAVIFSYWVNNFSSFNKVYGSIGTMLVIMVLIYINSLILLIGFELNVSIAYLTKEAEERMLSKAGLKTETIN